jgi:lysine 2,3-aminomutase
MQTPFKPRGSQVSLTQGSLPEVISPYLLKLIEKTGGANGPIGRQFIAQPAKEQKKDNAKNADPYDEALHEVAPGVVYKYRGKIDKNGNIIYHGRILWTISRFCATYCRFCFRGRLVGLPTNSSNNSRETLAQKAYLSQEDIEQVMQFIQAHKEINEVILSGGDPLISPKDYLNTILNRLVQLQHAGTIDIIRIHTRAPITNPFIIQPWHYDLLKQMKNPYIVLHINHPAEITPEVIEIITKLRESGVILLSQSVLLKGVNDDVDTLCKLFNTLVKYGVVPYYLHNNDPIPWAAHFTVPFKRAIKIWHGVRPRLSGLAASVKFVLDSPYGFGKVAIPEAGWKVDYSHFYDFKKKKHTLVSK